MDGDRHETEIETDEHGVVTLDLSELGLGCHRLQVSEPAQLPRNPRRARARQGARALRERQAWRALEMAEIVNTMLGMCAAGELLCGVERGGEIVFRCPPSALDMALLERLCARCEPVHAKMLAVEVSRPRPSVNRGLRSLALAGLAQRHDPACGANVQWSASADGRSFARVFLSAREDGRMILDGQPVGEDLVAQVRELIDAQRKRAAQAHGTRPANWRRHPAAA